MQFTLADFSVMLAAPPGDYPFLLNPKAQQADDFIELPLSNFCGYDNSIVVELVNGNHLSLLQVMMCCESNCRC